MTDDKVIDAFKGDFDFLSNFYPSPVTYEGLTYPTVEHAYQAAKTLDKRHRKLLTSIAVSAGQAKRKGKMLDLRKDWEDIKLKVMAQLLLQKFKPGTNLGELLDLTGDYKLIEGNTWGDVYWGVCKGQGSNCLGKLLMGIRERNREQAKKLSEVSSLGMF